MSLFIAGSAWVTPLGSGIAEVWNRLLNGEEAQPETISESISDRTYPVFRVPSSALENVPRHPRLRRASAISKFAAAAGLAALENAKSAIGDIDLQRTALIFGIANGGVIYTKRFYHDIVNSGAQSASPLLFPETVFNAPASHLAAILGIEKASYTVVGDGTVGLLAMEMAQDLLATNEVDHCLVVAAEEADWLLCDGYHRWRLLRSGPPLELFAKEPKGTILSEGAGAVFVSHEGNVRIDKIHSGSYYNSRAEGVVLLKKIADELATSRTTSVITSANGTFTDALLRQAVVRALPKAQTYSVAPAMGEGVGASALWQTVAAVQALNTARIPSLLQDRSLPVAPSKPIATDEVLVIACGLNQQAAGLRLSRS